MQYPCYSRKASYFFMKQMKGRANNSVALFITVPGKFICLKMRWFKLLTLYIMLSLEVWLGLLSYEDHISRKVPTFSLPFNLCNRLAKIHMYPSVIYQHIVHFEIGFLTVFLLILSTKILSYDYIIGIFTEELKHKFNCLLPHVSFWKCLKFLHCTISKEIVMLCLNISISNPSSSVHFTTLKIFQSSYTFGTCNTFREKKRKLDN